MSAAKRPAAEAAVNGSAAKRAKTEDAHPIGSREHFLAVYEELRDEIVHNIIPSYGLPAEAAEWNREMMEYNVPGGKLNRGLTVVHVLQSIRGDAITREEAKLAAVLGWAIEWLQAFFLVADDVMDGSITRRGQPCWYKLPKVGMTAVNDAFLLQAHLFKLLKKYFGGNAAQYATLLELFNETTWQTELGQLLDLTSQPAPGVGPIDLDRFTLQRYKSIVKYKTAYYSFYLPVACGFVLAGGRFAEPATLAASEKILVAMGEYFQVQDDYLDAYAPPEVLGKIGTDIQDNKCSWLVVQALARSTPEQLAVLKANYGKHDDAAVATVKELYRALDLEAVFKAYEAESYASLKAAIEETAASTSVPAEVYLSLLHKIYKRQK